MPFVNGRYVPQTDEQKQELKEKKSIKEKKEKKAKKKGEVKQELTPEQLEEIRLEEERKIAESAARFEELISTDTPDLENLNKLIDKEKKKSKSVIKKNRKNIKFVLTVILIFLIFLLFAGISFRSADIIVAALILMVVFSAVYFITVPR